MSKNHPHDNIYSILGKLDALKPTPEEKHQSLIKEIRESVEAQGSITEGVSATEAKLARQFAEGKDEGKPGKTFAKIAKSAGEHYGSAEAGKRVAGAVRAKLAKQGKLEETFDGGMGAQGGVVETAPPGMEDMVMKLKKEYPGEPAKAFATAWSIYNKKHGKKEESREACTECSMEEALSPEQSKRHDAKSKEAFIQICRSHGMSDEQIKRKLARWAKTPGQEHMKGMQEDPQEAFQEGEVTQPMKGVTRHTKTDYPGYPSDDLEKDDDRTGPKAVGGKGRPRKASTVNPRVDPNAPKKGRGRPSKVTAPGASTLADPFGRVTGITPKGKKGTVHSMDESMARMESRFLIEMNFRKMEEETGHSMDELMSELQQDINHYKSTGHCSDKLKDFLSIHSHSKKQMADEAAMEAAAQQPAPVNPHPVGSSLPASQIPGKADLLKGKGRDYYEEETDPLEGELNELAKLAGLKVADEGNAFTGKLKSTPKGGNFELGGKGYTDTSTLDEEPNEGNAFSGKLAQAKAQHKDHFELGGREIEVQEADVTVDAEPEEHANSPKEKYLSMKASTMNPGEADNGEKAMHPDRPTFKNGDNALARPATSKATTLEARLSAEYESIKKVN